MAAKLVLVSGASSGIGEATARHLARVRRARLVLVARREERLRALAADVGQDASFVALDVTAPDAPRELRSHVEERHGRADVLVNNAGAAWREPFAEGGSADMERTLALNLLAPVRLTEELLPLLRAAPRGAIVNVASVAGRIARPSTGAYSASKGALIAWTDALRAEEAANGVHAGTVLPGFVETEGFPATELRSRRATRWIVSRPERVAEAIEEVAFEGRPERTVPRPYRALTVLRMLAPTLFLRVVDRGGGDALVTRTGDEK
jgi:uncharacterized protein